VARVAREPKRPDPLPPMPRDPAPRGTHAVQVVRTYAARRPPYPFAPEGERSIARTYLKAFRRAERLIYLEDQYLWSAEGAEALVEALHRAPELRIVAVVPRHPDRDGRFSGPPYRIGQQRVFDRLSDAAPGRVQVFDLENPRSLPVYVHAKVCIIDDVWMMVGSDNFNLRSWTNDSELSCAILDEQRDEREPLDPAEHGDCARRLARDTRLRLWREHLDPVEGAAALIRSARALDAWHDGGRGGERPPGRLRAHRPEAVPAWHAWWAAGMYRSFVDPDGRPRALRRQRRF
jgi:phosphatidylserine/phosphatidylglycerophosphate/cardiolipin synthase-like enzyme